MARKKGFRTFPSLICRGFIFLLLLIFFMLSPSNIYSAYWAEAFFPLNSIRLFFLREQCVGPLCYGAFIFLLLGLADNWIRKKGVRVHVEIAKNIRLLLFILFCILTLAGIYWTVGFCQLTIFPPMPFSMGRHIIEHPFILRIWWSIVAILLHISMLCPILSTTESINENV